MNRTNGILALILASLVIMLIFVVGRQKQNTSSRALSTKTSVFATKTNDEGSVIVEVTPITLKPGESPSFKVAFNTHSVDLGFNVEDIISLTDNNGNIIESPKWIGTPAGGHHRSGELHFDGTLGSGAESVSLIFKNIAGVPRRVFTWNLP